MALSTFLPIWHIQKYFTAGCWGDCLYIHPSIVTREQITWPRITFSANRHLLTPLALFTYKIKSEDWQLGFSSFPLQTKSFWYFTDFTFAKLFSSVILKGCGIPDCLLLIRGGRCVSVFESLLAHCLLCLCQPVHKSIRCWTLLNTADPAEALV